MKKFEFSDDAARRILGEQVKKAGGQRQVAEQLDCTVPQVSKWLSGSPMSRGSIHRVLSTFDPKYWNRGK